MHLSYKRNVGNTDRVIRTILGIVLLYLAIFQPYSLSAFWITLLAIVGAASVIEGVIGY